jgi:alkylation response protein AidB-like acyl-CoA dehydrogenase
METLTQTAVDFSLSAEQRAIQEAARDFARREVDPIVDEHDEAGKYPLEVIRKAAELGFLGIIFPEEYGGAGLGYVEYVLVVTELSKVDPSVGISVAAHNSLGTNHVYKFGNDEQRRRWVTPLARGEKIAAWALTEPGSGSDAAAARTTARKVDGGWVLNGTKAFCTHGSVGDTFVIMAVSDPAGRKGANMSAFVVEKGASGLRSGKKENKLGIRASDTAEVILENCFVADDQLLGKPGEGFKQALEILDGGRISIAALGLGTAAGAYETALAYSKEREQFGKPIASFQAIQFALAEMATRIAAAEALTMAAAVEMDRTGKVTLKASEAKLMTGEAAVFCSERGVQIHGGYGFIKDYRAEKYYRDCKICTIGEGTSEIQRLVIARQLLKQH